MRVFTYDIETLINCFTVTFQDVKTNRVYSFVVCDWRDDRDLIISFLQNEVSGLIGFNNLGFDSPILRYISTSRGVTASYASHFAYQMAQEIVTADDGHRPKFALMPHHELDLYKLYHFDNEARRTSLKWIMCHLKMKNLQDMPIDHGTIITEKDVKTILEYNQNDVEATTKLYLHKNTTQLLALRKWAKKEYGLPSMSISNAHMGELIFMRSLGDIPDPDRSVRAIHVKDLILPQIQFKTKEFAKVLTFFKNIKFQTKTGAEKKKDNKGAFGTTTVYKGMKYVFGLGGIHAAMEDSLYTETIDSVDVKSFYPNIAIQFLLRPKHTGPKFTAVYTKLFEERSATKDPIINNGLKEALNSVFGKSNSFHSPLYDPAFTFSITVNGQLLMAMLAESIVESGAGIPIMVNTDGMEVIVKNRPVYEQCLNDWVRMTKMTVSQAQYTKMMIRDVNNYMAMKFNGDIKSKGAYEIDKDWHKDPSARILAIAARAYFVNGTDVTTTVMCWLMTSDFHMFKRAKTGKMFFMPPDGSREIPAPKTLRYLATEVGFVLYQETDAMKSKVHNDTCIGVCNHLDDDDFEKPVPNRKWYVKEAKKLIVKKTANLFD